MVDMADDKKEAKATRAETKPEGEKKPAAEKKPKAERKKPIGVAKKKPVGVVKKKPVGVVKKKPVGAEKKKPTGDKKPKAALKKKAAVGEKKLKKPSDSAPAKKEAKKRKSDGKDGETVVKKKKKTAPGTGKSEKGKKVVKVGRPRNYDLGNGILRFSRSRMYKKRAIWKFVAKAKKGAETIPVVKKPKRRKTAPKVIRKPIGGEKNGGQRLVRVKKLPSYYPTEPKFKKSKKRKPDFSHHKRFLRKSITPGTILIIVAGKHRGKRVVFLKQLKTGMLLVTGPYKLNRCPLRRINQIYVIATKTKLNMKTVKIPANLDDQYFKRIRPRRPKKDEGEIFETKKESYRPSEQRKKDQITVDKQILEVIRKHRDRKSLFAYIGSMFSLRNHMMPHKMRF